MAYNKILSILTMLSILFLVSPSIAYAQSEDSSFTLFGIDFGQVWDYVAFWQDDEPVKKTTTSTKSKAPSKPPVDFNITLAGQTYKKSQIISKINSNDEYLGYVKGFNYNCIAIETDKGEKFTMYFNTNTGKVTNVKHSLSCDKKIYVEESLITDIKKNGFEAKSIKSYLGRVDLPTTMYFKAIKVFTVG